MHYSGTIDFRNVDFKSLVSQFTGKEYDLRGKLSGAIRLEGESVTTGNFAGADITLKTADAGTLAIFTPHVKTSLAVRDIGYEDSSFEAGGLGRRVRVFRLPDANPHLACAFECDVPIAPQGDTPVHVRVTLENGHQAWSSPIYLFH